MRVSCSLGSLLTVGEVLSCARQLEGTRSEAVWVPETWGMENLAMLGAVAASTSRQKVGSSIINAYSRSPAAIAMGAATVDAISGGRLLLGLGTSSRSIVEGLHGAAFERPLRRLGECVEVVRMALAGKRIDYDGEDFRLRGFRLMVRPQRRIPVYLAAVGPGAVRLAWEAADGVIFYLRPLGEMAQTIPRMQSRREIDVACQVITCVSEDGGEAVMRAKRTLAFYVATGEAYRGFLAGHGFEPEVRRISGAFAESGLAGLAGLVPDSMVDELCIAGTPERCRRQLRRFAGAGVGLPILQFNPVGDTAGSFELLRESLLG